MVFRSVPIPAISISMTSPRHAHHFAAELRVGGARRRRTGGALYPYFFAWGGKPSNSFFATSFAFASRSSGVAVIEIWSLAMPRQTTVFV